MREIVWDTETTGFKPEEGHRLVEIGAIELVNHLPTENVFHEYINPERDIPEEAFNVHGLSIDFLKDKPVFAQIAQKFVDFVGDATLVAHNASFDMHFINYQLKELGFEPIPMSRSLDTLAIARKKFPGAQNSLDALCRRFGVDNSAREKHGALLDSEILAEVYLELIGGRQPDFGLSGAQQLTTTANPTGDWTPPARPRPLPSRLTEAEKAAHDAFVDALGEKAFWRA
ncbi:DNA polymerase-3 subunit epsilon [Rubricella aquisinus]|uniref:DNA polymerase III subunit epsilon n=1 Tax=Rubricella aquisinus TaxID=2028108 RepID=A0A840WLF3_9RHOB|nr:DNA polymerase III subunit epsilon [Rubricella aquisinus]MBB5514482.1 DNA polymerase-3 subunit epsilon [Rubricella aquisinus]